MLAAMSSDVAGGLHASTVPVVSAMSDNAGEATSRAFGVLKKEELARLLEDHLENEIGTLAAARHAYENMTVEQRLHAEVLTIDTCHSPTNNLVIEVPIQKTEAAVLVANMARDKPTRVIQRAFFRNLRNRGSVKLPRLMFTGYVVARTQKQGRRFIMLKQKAAFKSEIVRDKDGNWMFLPPKLIPPNR